MVTESRLRVSRLQILKKTQGGSIAILQHDHLLAQQYIRISRCRK